MAPVPAEVVAFHAEVMRTAMTNLSALFHRHELTPAQISTLFRLRADGPLTPGELSAQLGLTSATTAHLLNRLVARDLAERHRSTLDRRSHVVRLTAAGTDFLAEFDLAFNAGMERLLAQVPPDAVTRLASALREVLPHLT